MGVPVGFAVRGRLLPGRWGRSRGRGGSMPAIYQQTRGRANGAGCGGWKAVAAHGAAAAGFGLEIGRWKPAAAGLPVLACRWRANSRYDSIFRRR
ncbi:MAG: hypothetical protein OXF50_08700 [Caldilineaceae bacterium]|nr:hypothetical protein [Caldilineaceae bacterium]